MLIDSDSIKYKKRASCFAMLLNTQQMTQRMCLYFVPGNPEPAHQIHDVLPGHRSQYTLPHCSPTSPESVHYSHNVFMLATGNQYATSTMCSHWQSEASTLHPQCVHNGNPKPVHYIHSVFTRQSEADLPLCNSQDTATCSDTMSDPQGRQLTRSCCGNI